MNERTATRAGSGKKQSGGMACFIPPPVTTQQLLRTEHYLQLKRQPTAFESITEHHLQKTNTLLTFSAEQTQRSVAKPRHGEQEHCRWNAGRIRQLYLLRVGCRVSNSEPINTIRTASNASSRSAIGSMEHLDRHSINEPGRDASEHRLKHRLSL